MTGITTDKGASAPGHKHNVAIPPPTVNRLPSPLELPHGQECLDRFVIFGEQHMDHFCRKYLAHYHDERPCQSLEDEPITTPKKCGRPKTKRGNVGDEFVPLAEVRCKARLGGLLESYSRKTA